MEIAAATLSGVFTIGTIYYGCRRKKSTVEVNCWFCNRYTVVHYGNANCWDCPHCEQYNGFTQDGSYNKPIPSQYDESMNHSTTTLELASRPKSGGAPASNGLCETCNRNQQIKVAQLAHFVPINQDQEEAELFAFVRQLEFEYRLCRRCQVILQETLSKQDTVLKANLVSRQMSQKRQFSPVKKCRKKEHSVSTFVWLNQLVSVSIAMVLCFDSVCQPEVRKVHWLLDSVLPQNPNWVLQAIDGWSTLATAVGFCTTVVGILSAGKQVLRIIDAVCCFTWLTLSLLHTTPLSQKMLKGHLEKKTLQMMVSIISVVVTFSCIVKKRMLNSYRSSGRRSNVSSAATSYFGSMSYCSDSSALSNKSFQTLSSPYSNNQYDPLQDNEVTTSSPLNGFRPPLFAPTADSFILDSGIKAMKIGTPQKSPMISGAFGVRRPVQPLMADVPALGKRRPLVCPPKFQHTRSSWARMGPRSRSVNSRTTEFGHFGKHFAVPGVSINHPVSRAESKMGERFSVFGEPTQSTQPQDRGNNISKWCTAVTDRTPYRSTNADLVTETTSAAPTANTIFGFAKWTWPFYILTGSSLVFIYYLITRARHPDVV